MLQNQFQLDADLERIIELIEMFMGYKFPMLRIVD
jgi:hypothetical protein